MKSFFNYLMTASRDGDNRVYGMLVKNMAWQIGGLGVALVLWQFLRMWFFPTFDPFAYWNISDKAFWDVMPGLLFPVLAITAARVQSCWISGDHDNERSIEAQSIFFKYLCSLVSSITEEIGFRGVCIYFGLILVWVSNKYFDWYLAAVFIYSLIIILKGKSDIVAKAISIVLLLGCWYGFRQIAEENTLLIINKWFLVAGNFVAQKFWLKYLVGIIVAILAMVHLMIAKRAVRKIGLAEATYHVLLAATWFGYVFPLGIGTLVKISHPPALDGSAGFSVVPLGSDQWTALHYASAIILCNSLFRKIHSYQGEFGMLNIWVLSLYLTYITFTYGLMYAIIIHFTYNLLLFSGEHLIALVRNSGVVRTSFRT